MHDAVMLAYSENPDGLRLATFQVTLARVILAELNTHRDKSRNTASSRAMPILEVIRRIQADPYMPEWRKAKSGMQGGELIVGDEKAELDAQWLVDRDNAIERVMFYQERKCHKQDPNRQLEPWLFVDVVVSGTNWANMLFQRVHRGAHPAFQKVAYQMARLLLTERPANLGWGGPHLPYVTLEDIKWANNEVTYPMCGFGNYGGGPVDGSPGFVCQHPDEVLQRVSAARCGRVSFGKAGDTKTINDDLGWFNTHIYMNAHMGEPQHVSPAEHTAVAMRGRFGNFDGFYQLRKSIAGEHHPYYGIDRLNAYEAEQGWPLTEGSGYECV